MKTVKNTITIPQKFSINIGGISAQKHLQTESTFGFDIQIINNKVYVKKTIQNLLKMNNDQSATKKVSLSELGLLVEIDMPGELERNYFALQHPYLDEQPALSKNEIRGFLDAWMLYTALYVVCGFYFEYRSRSTYIQNANKISRSLRRVVRNKQSILD